MKPGDRVHMNLGTPSRPVTGAPDRNNRRIGTIVRSSIDGDWWLVQLEGDHHSNLRTVRPSGLLDAPALELVPTTDGEP